MIRKSRESAAGQLIRITRSLARQVDRLRFAEPVTHVYNPLGYAWPMHELYLQRFAGSPKEALLLGMNPGPWGMAQTGVPFGEVGMVRDWLGIEAPIRRPAHEHPRRPVLGLDCPRSEVSGRRLWGWAGKRYGTAERFFARFLVVNYCPLVFLEVSGRNRTPDRLPARERVELFRLCDQALRDMVGVLRPRLLVGVGRFATDRATTALEDALEQQGLEVGMIPHPSPANPQANKGWDSLADRALAKLGLA